MSQQQRAKVLSHLVDHGYITQNVATNYGIRSVSSRIAELRKTASINVELRKDDAGVRYAYYTLRYPRYWNDLKAALPQEFESALKAA